MSTTTGRRVALATGALGIVVAVAAGVALTGRVREEYWLWKIRSAREREDTHRALRALGDLRSRRGFRHVLREAADEAPALVGDYFQHCPYGIHVWSPVKYWHESYDRCVSFIDSSIDARGFSDLIRFAGEVALDAQEDLAVRAMAVDLIGVRTLLHDETSLDDPDGGVRVCAEVLKSGSSLLRSTAARRLPWCLRDPEAARRTLEGLAVDEDAAVRTAAAASLKVLDTRKIDAHSADPR